MKKVAGCKCILCTAGVIGEPRLPDEVFQQLSFMPLPLPELAPDGDGQLHYKKFVQLYGQAPDLGHLPPPPGKAGARAPAGVEWGSNTGESF